MSSWCFERLRRVFASGVGCCLLVSTLSAWAHPDLLLQIEQLDLEIQQQPDSAELLTRRGDLQRRHEDYAAATLDFSAARLADPDYEWLDFFEGRLMLEMGEPQSAVSMLSRHLETHPDDATAWTIRAQALMELGQPQLAAEDYAQAIGKSSKPSPQLYRQWGLALVAADPRSLEIPKGALTIGLEQYPRDVSLLGLASDIALAQGMPAEASIFIQKLPGGMNQLPRWQSRLELINCFKRSEEDSSSEKCRQAAVSALTGPSL